MIHFRQTLIVIVLFTAVFAEVASGGKVFRWVDEKGIVHFSDRPPEQAQSIDGAVEERDVEEPVSADDGPAPFSTGIVSRNPIEYAANATFTIMSAGNTGSGFFISKKGYAVTCKHVIRGSSDQAAVLMDQKQYPIRVISESHKHDLALILVLTSKETEPVSFRDSGGLTIGERIFAIGSPAGLQATVTDGVFTGFRRNSPTDDSLLQFSAPVNPGSSGGPLVDENGKVVGVVTSKYFTEGRVPLSGIGFALPSSYVLEAYADYIN
jgi:S1-C subfamily serine protease